VSLEPKFQFASAMGAEADSRKIQLNVGIRDYVHFPIMNSFG
jgi:hypothetical protein